MLASIAFLYFVLPQLAGVGGHVDADRATATRSWLAVGARASSSLSFAGYVVLFRGVFVPPGSPLIGWRESYQITMAGLAATRLFAAGGAGGVALTAWALRRSGMERREVADRMVAFLVLLYVVYAARCDRCGIGLRVGLFPGGGAVRDHGRAGDHRRRR